jgi:S-DNA-T family DNA segregation ATPase FtsK/SpoIIIE
MAGSASKKTGTSRSASKKKSVRSTRTSSRTSKPTRRVNQATSLKPISPERQIDIIGIILAVIGIITLLSLSTAQTGKLTNWWVSFLINGLGWGAYMLPACLVIIGLWLLLRKISKIPQISSERVIGFILGFFNLLAWFQLLISGQGGKIGTGIISYFQMWFGKPGTIVALVAWMLTSLILLLDLSMADVSKWTDEKVKRINLQLGKIIKEQREKSKKAKEALRQTATPASENLSSTSQAGSITSQASLAKNQIPGTDISTEQGQSQKHSWVLPDPIRILSPITKAPLNEEVDKHRARVIEETLKSFSTPAHVVEIRRGPAITMFGVKPDYIETRNGKTLVRVSNIVRLQDDIAMALQATQIRIQAPVPGKDYVGIELPNGDIDPVSLLEVIQSPAFTNHKGALKFGLGKDVSGRPAAADLTSMPHLLIAGATNSGKSVCINAILAGFLMTLTPDQLRIIMVDPKRVELTNYNGIPHLLAPVIVDADRVVGALQWMMREMDMRYHKFSDAAVRNIVEFNAKQASHGHEILPYLLLVIDEMADLMMLAPDETERSITRLAQLARATGIHLILATQRPSTDILTGLIKANFPARIAFAVASGVDSRVILDQPGAERLLGRGDMLFQAPDAPAPVRLQGTYVSDQEINALVHFWHQQALMNKSPEQPDQAVSFTHQTNAPFKQEPLWEELQKDPDEDPLTNEATAIIRQEGRASISLLQKKLRIGYTRSARLIEKLEEKGIIGAPDPQTQVRAVLDYGQSGPPADN